MGVITKAYPMTSENPTDPSVGGRAYQHTFDFTATTLISYTLAVDSTTGMDNVKSCFIDNKNNPNQFIMIIPPTNETIVCPAYSQAFFPILFTGSNLNVTAQCSAPLMITVQFLNVEKDISIWYVTPPQQTGTQPVSGTVVTQPITGAYTNRSGTIANGGASQQLAAANGLRKRFLVINPATANGQNIAGNLENLYVNFTAAAGVEDAQSIELLPGGSYDTGDGAVTTELINVTAATTGHRFIAKELQ